MAPQSVAPAKEGRSRPTKVQIVLFDGFDLLDALGPYEVFQAARMVSGDGVEVELVSMDGARAVPSAPGGLPIVAQGRPDLHEAKIIILPGAAGPLAGEGPDTVPMRLQREAAGAISQLAREVLATPGKTLATVCGGSLILGMAGLLEGRPAVTHHLGMDLLGAVGATAIKARVVDDGNLVTGAGVTSGIDVALHLVERELGPQIAHAVEVLFEHERRGTVWRQSGFAPLPNERQPAAGAASVSQHAPPKGCSGRWRVVIYTPIGKQEVIYEIADKDGVISGTAEQGGERTPLEGLVVSGARMTWSQRVAKPMKLNLKFDVTVGGHEMTGSAKPGLLPASRVEGRRIV